MIIFPKQKQKNLLQDVVEKVLRELYINLIKKLNLFADETYCHLIQILKYKH